MIQKCSIWRVFAVFAERPQKSFHVRELSKQISLSPTSVNIHLKKLEKAMLIVRETEGLYDSYKADFNNESFRFYKRIHNVVRLRESGLIEELENKLFPTAIVLFGSYMKGEDIETSDIDLFLLAEEKNISLEKYERALGRRIQIFFSADIKKLPRELKNNILNGIVIYGYLKVF